MPTSIDGAYIVELEQVTDSRGSFARSFDRREFAARGLVSRFDQESLSSNVHAGTLRGLHYQKAPFAETKLVVCVSGAAFDVIVDLRPGPDFGHYMTIELSARNWHGVYIPAGCAHGFQTRENDTTLLYRIRGRYNPHAARGVRWDDPELAIPWPLQPTRISDRDSALPLLARLCTDRASDPDDERSLEMDSNICLTR